jgi:hypothetical protein
MSRPHAEFPFDGQAVVFAAVIVLVILRRQFLALNRDNLVPAKLAVVDSRDWRGIARYITRVEAFGASVTRLPDL